MNDQIQKLANRHLVQDAYDSYGDSYYDPHYEFYHDELHDFITDIVLECTKVLEDLRGYSGVGTDGNPYDTPSWNAALESAKDIIRTRIKC